MLRTSTACRWLLVGSVGLLTAFGCEDEDNADTSVDIELESTPDGLGGASTSAAYLSIKSIEVVPCDGAGAFRWKAPFAMRTAWAHETTTPTRLGVPALDDLGGATKVVTLGTLAPPSVAYCSVRIGFGPADADALGMPSDRAAVGRTLWVAGRAGDPLADFKLTTNEARSVDLPVSRFRPGEHGRRTTVRLSRPVGNALAGVDLSPSAIDAASRMVLERVVAATRAEVR